MSISIKMRKTRLTRQIYPRVVKPLFLHQSNLKQYFSRNRRGHPLALYKVVLSESSILSPIWRTQEDTPG